MKKVCTLSVFYLLLPLITVAQQFTLKDSVNFASVYGVVSTHWIDIDNDSIQEVVFQGQDPSGTYHLLIYDFLNQTTDTISVPSLSSTPIEIEDIDNNNQLDIIAVTKTSDGKDRLEIYFQDSTHFDVTFQLEMGEIHSFYIKDWNNDGFKDILIEHQTSDSLALDVLFNSSNGFSESLNNLLTYYYPKLTSFFDANADGSLDLISLPEEDNDTSSARLYYNINEQPVLSDSTFPSGLYNNIALADFNSDGQFDVFSSTELEGNIKNTISYQGDSILKTIDFPALPESVNMSFPADLNSDGLADVFVSTDSVDHTKTYILQNHGQGNFTVDTLQLSFHTSSINFADHDLDGDLDLISFNLDSGLVIQYYENTTSDENYGPSSPGFHTVIQKGSEQVIVWDESIDDHTSSESITYDVFLGNNTFNSSFLAPNYDLESSQRLKFVRGNISFKNDLIIKLAEGAYNYGIQAIDNSLSAIPNSVDSLCNGRNIACGEFIACSTITQTSEMICKEMPTFFGTSGIEAYWYSENQGYLGQTDLLSYSSEQPDTLYATAVSPESCNDHLAIAISILSSADFIFEDIIVCQPEEIEVTTPFPLDSVEWFSKTNGFFGDNPSQTITISENDSISVRGYINGCELSSGFQVLIDTTSVTTGETKVYEILQGSSLNLSASGALTYSWSPTIGLDNPSIANPDATPLTNTTYYVTGISEYGCSSIDSVQVIVKNEAFIPSLFTPNNDGNNDRLLIYGLNSIDVQEFQFVVYNRSGNKVFETSDINFMNNSGWTGETNSSPLSTGIYYWQVRGTYVNGDPLLLNNEQKGKVFLTR